MFFLLSFYEGYILCFVVVLSSFSASRCLIIFFLFFVISFGLIWCFLFTLFYYTESSLRIHITSINERNLTHTNKQTDLQLPTCVHSRIHAHWVGHCKKRICCTHCTLLRNRACNIGIRGEGGWSSEIWFFDLYLFIYLFCVFTLLVYSFILVMPSDLFFRCGLIFILVLVVFMVLLTVLHGTSANVLMVVCRGMVASCFNVA